ncbi:MAG: M23 family metallopeptidase [Candidatus Doudnabacteria bacterium]|nr:M23 family metallopeptidase [Candidatus Doudnabacteria bacterium]
MRKFYWIAFLCLIIVLGFTTQFFVRRANEPVQPKTKHTQKIEPLQNIDNRVTKKPFGIFITKENSPVQPERFSGYHTGTDFETTAEEANSEVPFYAVCDGKILQKRAASGYGGVLVQTCQIQSQDVTVIYGHVSLKSINKNIGDNLTAGDKIGILGQPPDETDGERKHLHLGIHKGTAVNILGYAQSLSALVNWLDYEKITK